MTMRSSRSPARKRSLPQKQATLDAAQRQWDNPVEATRAVATGEAMVDASQAQLEKLDAEIAVESAKLTQSKEEFERTEQAIDAARARARST